ncbi:MAG: YraN family protein [Oscillospiraceae bacterium]|jgi:putative endonuclease|nr:YraN family protein [Oscillospiraceae bacterium]
MSEEKSRQRGKLGEKIAVKFLIKNNYSICKKNFYSKYGEIDIIAENDDYLSFIEVKTRSNTNFATPIDFVDKTKQQRIIKTAIVYLSQRQNQLQPRFDVIEILILKYDKYRVKIRHTKNAFCQEKSNEFF